MALYGEARDISFFRHINRELMGNIISQQCILYKYKTGETKTNIYGEATEGRYFADPIILNCLIERSDQNYPESDMGVDFQWGIIFKFFRDDLLAATNGANVDFDKGNHQYGANIVPEIGDIILYNNGYYEIDNTNANQFVVGKNPDYPNYDDQGNNPLETGLENFGSSISIICNTHYVPADRLGIQLARL